MKPGISLSRIYRFSAAHRLHSEKLNEAENLEVYDKCNNLNGHGHDYIVEISISGEPDPQTGMIIALEEFDRKVHMIIDQLDYRHLNKEVPYFKDHLSTGEVIIQYLWDRLTEQFEGYVVSHLKLWETSNNYFEMHIDGERI